MSPEEWAELLLHADVIQHCTTEESNEFIKEAMKQGFVVTTLVKVLVVGPAGVGKTCLLYLLLSKDPPDQRTSTGCAERSIRVIRIGKESGEWSEIPTEEFEEMIAEAVPVLYEELKAKGKGMEDLNEVLSQVVGEDEEKERGATGLETEVKEKCVIATKQENDDELVMYEEGAAGKGNKREKQRRKEIAGEGNQCMNERGNKSAGVGKERVNNKSTVKVKSVVVDKGIVTYTENKVSTVGSDEEKVNDGRKGVTVDNLEGKKNKERGVKERKQEERKPNIKPTVSEEEMIKVVGRQDEEDDGAKRAEEEEHEGVKNKDGEKGKHKPTARKEKDTINVVGGENSLENTYKVEKDGAIGKDDKKGEEQGGVEYKERKETITKGEKKDASVGDKKEKVRPLSAEETISKVIQNLSALIKFRKKSRRLLDTELIYLTDCGGQQAYWDLVPIFTRDTSATLFVHRLCEKLDEHPLNDLYQKGKRVGPSQRATFTTAESFKTMLRGLNNGDKRSKIIVVGTHKDVATHCKETPQVKNKKLAAIALPYFKDNVVYCNEAMNEIVFQLNTKNPDSNDKKEARKLRQCIMKDARQHAIPIWWFIFQFIMEALSLKLKREVLSKKEVIQVSDSLGFTEGELDAALSFFDKLNIFFYKKTILPEVVFTNVRVPLDKLSKLVEEQYHLRAVMADPTKASDNAMTGDWQKFRDYGILTLDFLEEFKEHYVEGIFTARDFLILLEKLMVISKLPNDEYFFPAILNMTSEDTIKECLESCKRTKIAALVVKFPTGWAPPGVYCCSVCHLQSHSGWEVVSKPPIKPLYEGSSWFLWFKNLIDEVFNTKRYAQNTVSRNSIEFTKAGRPGSVTFIDHFSFFTACVNLGTSKIKREELAKHCRGIKFEIFAAVKAALLNTHHENTHPTFAFFCPKQKICSSKLHVANLSPDGKLWICSVNRKVYDKVTPDQTLWLNEPGVLVRNRRQFLVTNRPLASHS
ncbi:hypothetical protein GBAR_LOCUS1570 [Geodia barretti]|nr:hypothetical protein GBAR_LOCUS1570 [Geodia barretti]